MLLNTYFCLVSKKKNDSSGIVYSTNPSFKLQEENETESTPSNKKQNLKVWLERKGHYIGTL